MRQCSIEPAGMAGRAELSADGPNSFEPGGKWGTIETFV